MLGSSWRRRASSPPARCPTGRSACTCSHGEGGPAFAARRAGAGPASPRGRRAEGGAGRMKGTGRGGAGGGALGPGGAPRRPRRARPRGRGQARRGAGGVGRPEPGLELAKHGLERRRAQAPAVGTYLAQSRADPGCAFRERVRASFEASGGAYGTESVTADLRRGPGEPVSWRALAPGDAETPVVASEKVVRRDHARGGPGRPARRRRCAGGRGTAATGAKLAERPANVPLRRGRDARLPRSDAPGLLVVTDVTEFRLDGYRAYFSTASTGCRSAGGPRSTPTRT